jgi:hypothetical protein
MNPRRLTRISRYDGQVQGWFLWAPCASWTVPAVNRYTGPWNATTPNPVLVIGNRYDRCPAPGDHPEDAARCAPDHADGNCHADRRRQKTPCDHSHVLQDASSDQHGQMARGSLPRTRLVDLTNARLTGSAPPVDAVVDTHH